MKSGAVTESILAKLAQFEAYYGKRPKILTVDKATYQSLVKEFQALVGHNVYPLHGLQIAGTMIKYDAALRPQPDLPSGA